MMIVNKTNFTYSNKLLLIVLGILLFTRIIIVNFLNFTFPNIPIYIAWSIEYLEYAVLSAYIIKSWPVLNHINMENSTIYILIGCEILAHIPTTFLFWEIVLAFLFWITSIIIVQKIYRSGVKISRSEENTVKMVLVGIIIGAILVFLLKIAPFLLLGTQYKLVKPLINSVINFMILFVNQLGHSVIFEEILFRGMLIGYLQGIGFADKKVMVVQILCFMVAHINGVSNPYIFLIVIPIFSLVVGFLAIRYKSLIPSIFTHGVFNTMFNLFKIIK